MIEFRNVSKSYLGEYVLDNVSFRIGDGERAGFVGPNGAGKSTIFALLSGEISPDAGAVEIARDIRLGYVHQHLLPTREGLTLLEYAEQTAPEILKLEQKMHALQDRLHASDESGRETLLAELGRVQTRFEQMGGFSMRHNAEAALSGLGFTEKDLERPFASFSGGWQMRAELARCLAGEPSVLLLDEPSNYLDLPAVEWLQRFLRDYHGTLVLISHDRYLLNSLTRLTFEVANTNVTRYAGNYDYYENERVLRREQQLSAARNIDRKRRQVERFVDRFRATSTKASQVQSAIKRLDKMEEVSVGAQVMSPGSLRLADPPRSGVEVIRLDNAGVSYDSCHWVLRNIDWRITRGEKFALVGMNGRGKTTLMRALAGNLALTEGRRVVGPNTVTGYLSQEYAETMQSSLTVDDVVREAAQGMNWQERRNVLGSFGFAGNSIEKTVGVLSGGEKIRLALARLLVRPPNLLLLDEPTTHLDIDARRALEEALVEYTGTLCLVSHDVEFVRRVADRVVEMVPPAIRLFAGGYDYYKEKTQQEVVASNTVAEKKPAGKAVTESGGGAVAQGREGRRERALKNQAYAKQVQPVKREIARIEKQIATLESEQAELLSQMRSSGNVDYATINRQLKDQQTAIDQAISEWEKLSAKLERLEYAREQN